MHELAALLKIMETRICDEGSASCDNIKKQMEVELHQTMQAVERTEARLRQVEIESKLTLDKVEELKSKVTPKSMV